MTKKQTVNIFDIWRPQLPPKEVEVTKIGRKWIYTSYGRFYKSTGKEEEPCNYRIIKLHHDRLLGKNGTCKTCQEEVSKTELEEHGGECRECALPF